MKESEEYGVSEASLRLQERQKRAEAKIEATKSPKEKIKEEREAEEKLREEMLIKYSNEIGIKPVFYFAKICFKTE